MGGVPFEFTGTCDRCGELLATAPGEEQRRHRGCDEEAAAAAPCRQPVRFRFAGGDANTGKARVSAEVSNYGLWRCGDVVALTGETVLCDACRAALEVLP